MASEQVVAESLGRSAKLRSLAGGSAPAKPTMADFEAAFETMGGRLAKAGEMVRLEFVLGSARKQAVWSVVAAPGTSTVSRTAMSESDVSVMLSEEDAWNLARGKVSLLEVFGSGRMLVSGNCETAKRVFVRLAGRGETDLI